MEQPPPHSGHVASVASEGRTAALRKIPKLSWRAEALRVHEANVPRASVLRDCGVSGRCRRAGGGEGTQHPALPTVTHPEKNSCGRRGRRPQLQVWVEIAPHRHAFYGGLHTVPGRGSPQRACVPHLPAGARPFLPVGRRESIKKHRVSLYCPTGRTPASRSVLGRHSVAVGAGGRSRRKTTNMTYNKNE